MLVCTKNANVLILIISPFKISPKRTSWTRWNQLAILLSTILKCWPGCYSPMQIQNSGSFSHPCSSQSQLFWHCLKFQLLSLWNSITQQPFAVFTGSAKVTALVSFTYQCKLQLLLPYTSVCVLFWSVSSLFQALASFLPSFLIFFIQWLANLHQSSPSSSGLTKEKRKENCTPKCNIKAT